jgi:hypothetical protein
MISKCANPQCGIPLHYLRHGRIFRFNTAARPSGIVPPFARTPERIAHYWLCGDCCRNMTLVFDPFQGISVRPIELIHMSTISSPIALSTPASLPAAAGA